MNNKRDITGFKRWISGMVILVLCMNFSSAFAQHKNLLKIKDLRGNWKFSIGEREEWIEPEYDDSDWTFVRVPSQWENEGFHGYNGFATYRKAFTLSKDYEGLMLYLVLGYIDDVDEVFLNGKKIGSTGSFPPHYKTAYNAHRKYYIPENLISFTNENIITVKVYDAELGGGIVSGDVGIYSESYGIKPDISLQGEWKFRQGDNFDWKAQDYNHTSWDDIFIPSYWEDQGYRNYDGFAWYRKTFIYKGELNDKTLVILLGKIDDADQVFINGEFVGGTGLNNMKEGSHRNTEAADRAFRGYYFLEEQLNTGSNTIAIRVLDKGGEGGIYEGPIGIVTQTKYINFWRKRKEANRR